MLQIRKNVFETNSSSTHSLTMCSQDDYDRWTKGELLFSEWEEEFVTREEAIAELVKKGWITDESDEEEIEAALREDELLTMDDFFEDDYLETFTRKHTSTNGDKIVAFGKYGMG